MNYYPFHLGDYATHTAHLDPIEDLAYRRMLDLYYLRESPLPADIAEVARLIRLRDYQAQVESVLREFFQLTGDGWENARCHAEINAMAEKRAKARASAAASVNARRTNVERTLSERSATVELPTPTPIPTPEEREEPTVLPEKPSAYRAPPCPTQEIVDLYHKHLPMLPTVLAVSDSRKRAISGRWREVCASEKFDREAGLEWFAWYFEHASKSRFLTGRSKEWKADFDFLINPSKFAKVVEGTYHKEL